MIITLTTDFGLADAYVGILKGVILSIAPTAQVVDISHDIAPGNVRQAAFVLSAAAPFFPAGTIHMVVVDPGVGSARRAIAARAPGAIFLGPDNGVLSLCLGEQAAEIRQLSNARYHLPQVSATFHGRDVFAPVAAHLAGGANFDDLGPLVADPVVLAPPAIARTADGAWRGEIMHIDRFGNLITNFKLQISNSESSQFEVKIGGRQIEGLARTFADRAPGELLALVGSAGYLEIAARDGSAAQLLNACVGDAVWLSGQ